MAVEIKSRVRIGRYRESRGARVRTSGRAGGGEVVVRVDWGFRTSKQIANLVLRGMWRTRMMQKTWVGFTFVLKECQGKGLIENVTRGVGGKREVGITPGANKAIVERGCRLGGSKSESRGGRVKQKKNKFVLLLVIMYIGKPGRVLNKTKGR